MRSASHGEHQTRLIGAPKGWDPEKDGECGALSVFDVKDERGHNLMISRWELEPEDHAAIKAGAPVFLSIMGQVHPVVCVYVGGPTSYEAAACPAAESLTDAQIKHMTERFLSWKLPESFHPDAGISFKPDFNEHTDHPMKHQPTGTNLFDYDQAGAMVRHMVDGMPAA